MKTLKAVNVILLAYLRVWDVFKPFSKEKEKKCSGTFFFTDYLFFYLFTLACEYVHFKNAADRSETCKQSNKTIFTIFKIFILLVFVVKIKILLQGVKLLYVEEIV